MKNSDRGIWIALGVLVLVLAVGAPMLGGGMMGNGMMGWAGAPGVIATPWMWGFGSLMMLGFWGAIALTLMLLVRAVSSTGSGSSGGTTPMEILQRRYAAGEITREQYEEAQRVLQPHSS